MNLPVPFFVGLRYTRARRRNHFVSFISAISILGITVGVWALITVLSVMNGFERELRGRILSVASHVTVSARQDWLLDWKVLDSAVRLEPGVLDAAPYVLGQGLVTRGNAVSGVLFRGVEPELASGVSQVLSRLIAGNVADF